MKAMEKFINYRIAGTAIMGTADTVRDCRTNILNFYGKAKFEWWSSDGKRSGNAYAK